MKRMLNALDRDVKKTKAASPTPGTDGDFQPQPPGTDQNYSDGVMRMYQQYQEYLDRTKAHTAFPHLALNTTNSAPASAADASAVSYASARYDYATTQGQPLAYSQQSQPNYGTLPHQQRHYAPPPPPQAPSVLSPHPPAASAHHYSHPPPQHPSAPAPPPSHDQLQQAYLNPSHAQYATPPFNHQQQQPQYPTSAPASAVPPPAPAPAYPSHAYTVEQQMAYQTLYGVSMDQATAYGFASNSAASTSNGSASGVESLCRQLYFGNIGPSMTIKDILDQVRGGMVENVRMVLEKGCAFVSFVDSHGASIFLHHAATSGCTIQNVPIKVSWGKQKNAGNHHHHNSSSSEAPPPAANPPNHALPPQLALAISKGATRNVYVGGLDATMTQNQLMLDFMHYGPIDNVALVPTKSCAFIHFASIADAIQAVNGHRLKYSRISYGRDRCDQPVNGAKSSNNPYEGSSQPAPPQQHPGPYHHPQQHSYPAYGHQSHPQYAQTPPPPQPRPMPPMQSHAPPHAHPSSYHPSSSAPHQPGYSHQGHGAYMPMNPYRPPFNQHPNPHPMVHPAYPTEFHPYAENFPPNAYPVFTIHPDNKKVVYFGSLAEDVTAEDVCSSVRCGGPLYSIRMVDAKRCCFLSFVTHAAAQTVYNTSQTTGIVIKGRRVNKVGWGKETIVSRAANDAIQLGASRNIYLGNIDVAIHTEAQLRADFSAVGAVEQIYFILDKKTAFVNFCSLVDGLKAMSILRGHFSQFDTMVNAELVQRLQQAYGHLKISFGKDRCASLPRPHFARPRSAVVPLIVAPNDADPMSPPILNDPVGAEVAAPETGPLEEVGLEVEPSEEVGVETEPSEEVGFEVENQGGENVDGLEEGESEDSLHAQSQSFNEADSVLMEKVGGNDVFLEDEGAVKCVEAGDAHSQVFLSHPSHATEPDTEEANSFDPTMPTSHVDLAQ